jgi:hypothetical protein
MDFRLIFVFDRLSTLQFQGLAEGYLGRNVWHLMLLR